MERLPKVLGTKQDILFYVEEAKKGKYDKAELARRLAAMRDAGKHWVFKAEVDADYDPGENEKVMTRDGEAGAVYDCFELHEDPGSPLKKAGYSNAEIGEILAQL